MKAIKVNNPEIVHTAAIKAVATPSSSGELKVSLLNEIFAPSFLLYGMAEDDKVLNYNDFQIYLNSNSRNATFDCTVVECRTVFQSFSPDGNTAVFVDELLTAKSENSEVKKKLRITSTLFNLEQGWRIILLHISSPTLESEDQGNLSGDWKKDGDEPENLLKERTKELERLKDTLRTNQVQLIKQEKLASLGQLTAGIAHEIKNPLNFINNFSELSSEFLEEIEENLEKLEDNETTEEIKSLLEDVKANLDKIHQHGSRADGIVKSMLLHSRGGSGKMEDIDLNALIREYVNLSFHGMRANKNAINVDIQVETDENLGTVKINPENFSRVILNLCKNAFDAMREKLEKVGKAEYLPTLVVRTKSLEDKILIEFEDNGPGVPDEIKEKMMLPFFTTKKGSDGTGLGLSISQDIIKDHQGHLEIDTREGKYTKFTIFLNRNK